MLRLWAEVDIADRAAPVLVATRKIMFKHQRAPPRDQHRMYIAIFPTVEPFHHPAERHPVEADGLRCRHRPLVLGSRRRAAPDLGLCELRYDGNPD